MSMNGSTSAEKLGRDLEPEADLRDIRNAMPDLDVESAEQYMADLERRQRTIVRLGVFAVVAGTVAFVGYLVKSHPSSPSPRKIDANARLEGGRVGDGIPDKVTVTFESEPPGALVFAPDEARPMGQTPITVQVQGSKTPTVYEFRLEGFRVEKKSIMLLGDTRVVAYMKTPDGEMPPSAAPEAPAPKPMTAAEKAAAEKAAKLEAEKAAKEQALAEKAAAKEKALAEKEAKAKALAEKTAAEKAAKEKALSDKLAAEKAAKEKAAADKAAKEQALADRAAKAAQDKAAREKAAAEKAQAAAMAKRLTEERAAATRKVAAEASAKRAEERAAEDKTKKPPPAKKKRLTDKNASLNPFGDE
jgi:hypothetical protein